MLSMKALKSLRLLNRGTTEIEKYFPVVFSDCKFDCIKLRRNAHTDIPTPDFQEYRRSSIANPHKKSSQSAADRKAFTCSIIFLGGLGGVYCGKAHLLHYILALSPARDIIASAKTEVKLNDITVGKTLVTKWQEKPVFITHRTQDVIDQEQATPLTNLRDPETDDQRAKRPEWLVVIGICTHLGCIPLPNTGDFPGGYFCPCHGSHFDGAGRARKGPALLNLVIPQYEFIQDDVILIG